MCENVTEVGPVAAVAKLVVKSNDKKVKIYMGPDFHKDFNPGGTVKIHFIPNSHFHLHF